MPKWLCRREKGTVPLERRQVGEAIFWRKWGKIRDAICGRFLNELTGKADNPNYLAAKQDRPRPKQKKHPAG